MPIQFQCSCGQNVRVKEDLAGKRVRCPTCKSSLSVPTSSPPPLPIPTPAEPEWITDVPPPTTEPSAPKLPQAPSRKFWLLFIGITVGAEALLWPTRFMGGTNWRETVDALMHLILYGTFTVGFWLWVRGLQVDPAVPTQAPRMRNAVLVFDLVTTILVAILVVVIYSDVRRPSHQLQELTMVTVVWAGVMLLADYLLLQRSRAGFWWGCIGLLMAAIGQATRGEYMIDLYRLGHLKFALYWITCLAYYVLYVRVLMGAWRAGPDGPV